ncbi:1-deoxy-D-xylulose-5-phosphate synthase [Streptomyces sp. NPDC051546]|uniref:1-deoxy-D-xylulose-5-phosphate synthase n=1 Tax=Streptomyces sp. NPDC051546 TaxID=3365655 RepID=UPI0037BD33FD
MLDAVASPGALRRLGAGRLEALACEMRAFLVEKVNAAGGHLGPNLGVVELTLALHRVFDVEAGDVILFDTGHQAYVHKMLTGRAKDFDTLRRPGGLSGYPSRAESPHDWIENSHASTALSYADGLAKARRLSGSSAAVVAVVGDGALTGGMSLEALNNLGAARERPVIVVLNDNGRSYAPTTGALAAHLAGLRTRPATAGSQAAQDSAGGGRCLFTDLGFAYLGPVDGHDVTALERALERARSLRVPVVVHAVTVKGRGHAPAEEDTVDCQHAVPARVPAPVLAAGSLPVPAQGAAPRPSWTAAFTRSLLELGAQRPDLVAVTAAMAGPTGLDRFAQRWPKRFFDVGIAEQHAVASAAGLALGGLHPVVALYATFLNRAFDQVLMDVALQRLAVTFVLDRAGITGPDGASHHGLWDLSILGAVPGMRVAAPRDSAQLHELLAEAVAHSTGPTALRFPKGSAGDAIPALSRQGSLDVLYSSGIRDVLLVPVGPIAGEALKTAAYLTSQGIGTTVADPRWVLPIAPELTELACRHRLVVTVEDHARTGGFGSALALALADAGSSVPIRVMGLPREFITHGTRPGLLAAAGLNEGGILQAVLHARAGHPHTTPVLNERAL